MKSKSIKITESELKSAQEEVDAFILEARYKREWAPELQEALKKMHKAGVQYVDMTRFVDKWQGGKYSMSESTIRRWLDKHVEKDLTR